jgi:hypothetical protein
MESPVGPDPYDELKRGLARGWNTWNTRSVLSHVLLPEGIAVNLGIKEYRERSYLKESLIGRRGEKVEVVMPGARSYDGRYTDVTVRWKEVTVRVQSATEGEDLLLLVTPLASQTYSPATLVVEGGVLWNWDGCVRKSGEELHWEAPGNVQTLHLAGGQPSTPVFDPYIPAQGCYLAYALNVGEAIALHTGGVPRSRAQIEAVLSSRQKEQEQYAADRFGELAEVYRAMQTCLAWNTVYDPLKDRVVSPVSRIWNCGWGGYVLFCWDTYFAAAMAAIDNRDLAYANAIEITREITESGFVPNFATVCDLKSYDRSQPPVGSLVVLGLYRTFGDKWLPEMLFDDLLRWNRWWDSARRDGDLLCWGSDPFAPRVGAHFETAEVDNAVGPMMESGLDNSPMWDGVPFDSSKHLQCLHDAGLNGLYVRDCESLEALAVILGRDTEAGELRARGDRYRQAIQERLWDEEAGLFLNRRTDTGERSSRTSPTNFYPLLGGAGTDAQATRMMTEHLLHPARFGGEFVLPSISRDDPAYPDQSYWRGRIWAPMNFLVYAGLCRYDLPEARGELAAKSQALLLKEWREHGRVCENYCADTGQGGEVRNSDAFYHWGGLLGLITFIEKAFLPDFFLLAPDNEKQDERD